MSRSYSDYYAAGVFGSALEGQHSTALGAEGGPTMFDASRTLSAVSQYGPSGWNSKKYNPPSGSENKFNNFVDLTDVYAMQGSVITFMGVSAGQGVEFKAFITSFNETYSVDWASEQVFGRTDPIQTFKQVTRNCTLTFVVPASTTGEAFENLGRVDYLLSLLYPEYENSGNALTIAQSPLVRINVANLLRKDVAPGFTYEEVFALPGEVQGRSTLDHWGEPREGPYTEAGSGAPGHYRPSWRDGAIAAISSVSVNHNLESDSGVAHGRSDIKMVLPKLIEIAMDFTILHEKTMGSTGFGSRPEGQDTSVANPLDDGWDNWRPSRYGVDLFRQDTETLATLRSMMPPEDEDDESAASQATLDGEVGRTGAALLDDSRASLAAYGDNVNHRGQSYIPSFTDGGTVDGANYYDYAVETHYTVGRANSMSHSDAQHYAWNQTWEDMSNSVIGDGTQAAVTEDAVRAYYENVASSPVRQSDGTTDDLPSEEP